MRENVVAEFGMRNGVLYYMLRDGSAVRFFSLDRKGNINWVGGYEAAVRA